MWTHLPSGRYTDPEQTTRSVENWIAGWQKDGLGTWVVREHGSDQVIGYGGLSDLGGTAWNLLAPERAIIAYLLEHNAASAAVARKIGLHLVERGPDAGNPDREAVRLVFADRELRDMELRAARR